MPFFIPLAYLSTASVRLWIDSLAYRAEQRMDYVKIVDTLPATGNIVKFEASNLQKLALVCDTPKEQPEKVRVR